MTDSLGVQRLADMVTDVGRKVRDKSTARQVYIKQALNEAYGGLAGSHPWDALVTADESGLRTPDDSNSSKTLKSDQAEAPMPWNADNIRTLAYQSGSITEAVIVTPAELFKRAGTRLNTTGQPQYAAPIGWTAQEEKLAASSIMTFYSTQANANEPIRVEHTTSTNPIGNVMSQSLSVTDWSDGTSPAETFGAGWPIKKVWIPANFNGDLSVKDASDNVVVRVLSRELPTSTSDPDNRIASRQLFRFWPVPDKDYAMTVIWARTPRRLVSDDDVPEISCSDYLVNAAAARVLATMGRSDEAQAFQAMAAQDIAGFTTKSRSQMVEAIVPDLGGIDEMAGGY